MRIRLQGDVGGDIRLRLLPDAERAPRKETNAEALLVCRDFLQDDIYLPQIDQPAGFGTLAAPSKFTSLAKRKLNQYGAVIDQGSLESCVFLTGTLPGGTMAAFRAIAEWSSWITSRLGQWLRDKFLNPEFFGVWEYQRRGALHLHVVVRLQTAQDAWQLKRAWKRRWCSLLDKVGVKAQVDLFERENGKSWQERRSVLRVDAQTVEKSVARYLSKYCSKTADKSRAKAIFPPASWWFCSQNLRRQAKDSECFIEISNLSLIDANLVFGRFAGELVSFSSKSYPIFNEWDHRQRGVICLMPSSVAGAAIRSLFPLMQILATEKQYVSVCKRSQTWLVEAVFGNCSYQAH